MPDTAIVLGSGLGLFSQKYQSTKVFLRAFLKTTKNYLIVMLFLLKKGYSLFRYSIHG